MKTIFVLKNKMFFKGLFFTPFIIFLLLAEANAAECTISIFYAQYESRANRVRTDRDSIGVQIDTRGLERDEPLKNGIVEPYTVDLPSWQACYDEAIKWASYTRPWHFSSYSSFRGKKLLVGSDYGELYFPFIKWHYNSSPWPFKDHTGMVTNSTGDFSEEPQTGDRRLYLNGESWL